MTEAGKIPKYRSFGILTETNNTESDTRQKSRFLPLSNPKYYSVNLVRFSRIKANYVIFFNQNVSVSTAAI